jgi:hypothetical protein
MRRVVLTVTALGMAFTPCPAQPVSATSTTPDHAWTKSGPTITDLRWTHDQGTTTPVTSDFSWRGGSTPVFNADH